VHGELIRIGETVLAKRQFADVKYELSMTEDALEDHILSHNDVVKGVYEGGFKTWECANDLVNYLSAINGLEGMQVLELGCGTGIPGLYLMKRGCQVDFQDYNHQVLEWITLPNVLLNSQDWQEDEFEAELDLTQTQSKFYSGDWSFVNQVLEHQYDIILTSETIYERQNHEPLFRCIQSSLKPGGRCYIAAKQIYFGCTGTLNQFIQTIKELDPEGRVETVFSHQETVTREI
ncbi:S-adenosyl-L-methionine-dependent methyltransferase, partial [Gorgonomyces haynaldii]